MSGIDRVDEVARAIIEIKGVDSGDPYFKVTAGRVATDLVLGPRYSTSGDIIGAVPARADAAKGVNTRSNEAVAHATRDVAAAYRDTRASARSTFDEVV